MTQGSLPPPTHYLASVMLGMWRLASRIDVTEAGKVVPDPVFGKDPDGILSFAETHFAAQFMKRDRSPADDREERIGAKNNSVSVNGYDAYFGSYAVDEKKGTLTTLIEGSVSPANIGQSYVRDIRVVGDTLIIQLHTTSVDGTPVTRTNTFVRLGSAR